MGDALEMPVVPLLTVDHRSKRPVNFRKHRKGDREWRARALAAAALVALMGSMSFLEGRYLLHYWQMRQAVAGGHLAQAETAYQQLKGWWVPIRPRGEGSYAELFARRAAFLGYLKAIEPYQQEGARLETQWRDLRQAMMQGKVTDEVLLDRLEEIVRASHQLVLDLPKPETFLHASDVAVHQDWVMALKLREQALTQLWYAFHLHDPGKVTSANQMMLQSREAQLRYETGLQVLQKKLGQP